MKGIGGVIYLFCELINGGIKFPGFEV